MKYIIYNAVGKILRVIECAPTLAKIQVHAGEFILEGEADDVTQKIVDGKIVDKDPGEIEAVSPVANVAKVIAVEKRLAYITNKQWQDVLDRLDTLEKEKV